MKRLIKIPLLLTQITNFVNLQQPNIEILYSNEYNNMLVQKTYYESDTFQLAETTMKVEQNNITLGINYETEYQYINIQLNKFIIQPNKLIQNNRLFIEFTQQNFYNITTTYLENSKSGFVFSTKNLANDYKNFPMNKLQQAFYNDPEWVTQRIQNDNNYNDLIQAMSIGFQPPTNVGVMKNYEIQGILEEQPEEHKNTEFTDGYYQNQLTECELYNIPSQTIYLYSYIITFTQQTSADTINYDYVNWVRGSSEYDNDPTITTDIVDIPTLMFSILTLPFTFISQAFNLTLFPNTPYAINVSNLFLTIIGALIFMAIFVIVIKIIRR